MTAVLFLNSCGNSNTTVGPADTGSNSGSDNPAMGLKIDPALDRLNPEFNIVADQGNSYTMSFMAGAGGSPESESQEALRSIRAVEFRVYTADNQLLATRITDSVPTSGVMNRDNGTASVIAATSVRYSPSAQLPDGTYGMMVVEGKNGVAVRSEAFPVKEFVH
jgi:hypothetical protein